MGQTADPQGRILVADDDGPLGRLFKAVLSAQGHEVEVVTDGETARRRIIDSRFDLVLLDLTMGPVGGLALLEHTRQVSPETTVVIITGNATVESAVQALKNGAHDYLVKPVQNEQVVVMVRRALQMRRLGEENRRAGEALREEKQRNASLLRDIKHMHTLSRLAGTSPVMREVRALIEEVTRSDSTVLILGESGTGKSLLARTIHFNSHRADRPFIETNCAVYSEGLLMSELFGHEVGAFTGAARQKKGRFELAEGGTVFLDEIGDIPPATQIALLRFLQERCFERVGGEETLRVSVRVIAATNRDLAERMKSGTFREDLFYRLNVIPITLPPLRERKDDIPMLADRILAECCERLRRPAPALARDAVEALVRYPWPGNIREMENAIERAVLLSHGEDLTARYFPAAPGAMVSAPAFSAAVALSSGAGPMTLGDQEKAHIVGALERCRWNKKKAAALLGINRSSLYSKMKRFGIPGIDERAESALVGAGVQNPDTP